ncbi:hypothetical protein RsoM2USA_64 [Ralstonia phage RsoM2USA]|nr:hypothetical protein RsoM2USA_64 [Ralstonia phage RsoM2USA]
MQDQNVTVTLPASQWEILTNLLDLARDEFANHSCNDYFLPFDENEKLIRAICSKEFDDEVESILEDDNSVCIPDFILMSWFKKLIKTELEKNDDDYFSERRIIS